MKYVTLVIRNAVCLLALAVVSVLYLSLASDFVPDEIAILVNLIVVPFGIGWIGFITLKGPVYVRLLLLALIPILHVLYFGGDAAKPGLENLLAAVELLAISVGLGVGYGASKLFRKRGAT